MSGLCFFRSARLLLAAGIALLALGRPAVCPARANPSPIGRWLTGDRSGVIEIAPCGAELCGRIVGMLDWPDNGDVPRDVHGNPQCGMTIIAHGVSHSAPLGENRWDATILNPEDGRTYSAEFWTDPQGRLHLRGYIGIPLFGATQVWTRYQGSTRPDCRVG